MFQLANKDYTINHLNFKQSIQLPPPNKQDNTFHTSVIHRNSLYLYTWPDTCSVLKLQIHPSKNQKSQTITQLKLNYDPNLDFNISEQTACYGSAILNNQLHLLVSKISTQPESSQITSILKLNLATGIYSNVCTSGQQPSFRTAPLVEPISNMYVLFYGGSDLRDNSPCSDAYALIFAEWMKLKIVNPIEPRTHFASTVLNRKIYLHGGHLIQNDRKQYFSDMYELTFSDTKKQLIFQPIHYSMEPIPTPRSNHKMSSVSSRYLIIFGGISQEKTNQGSKGRTDLKDFWVFDLLERKWMEIQIDIQKINFHSLFSSSNHLNELFIFGAFQNVKNSKRVDLIKFQFSEKTDKKIGSLINHEIMNTKVKNNLEGSKIEFATSLIHNTSYLIKFPFQAIQRIIQFAEIQNAQIIKIYSEMTTNTIEKYIYISIDIKSAQDMQTQNDFDVKVQKLFVYCLRMGKTALYVQNYKKTGERKVYLMSADGRFAPLLQRLQVFYSYTQRLNNSGILSVQNSLNRQIIYKILEGLIENPETAIRSIEGGKIMIFTPNIIPTPKSYFYELVFDSLADISLFKNNKKLELLDKVKYDLGSSMEFSLNSYLKYSNTNKIGENKNRAKIFLSKSPNPIPQDKSYADYLEEFNKQGKIVKFNFPFDFKIKYVESYNLYVCQQEFYLPENNGILLYQKGHLVNRYECQFGKLLQDKFYHKKIRNKANNIFIVVGQIHLSTKLNLTNFNTEFQKTNKFIEFQLSLQTLIADFIHKMQPISIISKINEIEVINTPNQSQNASLDHKELNGHQQNLNQEAQVQEQKQLEQQIQQQEQQVFESNSHKKLKIDNQIEEVQEN